jgi:hypothetical protein
MSPLLFDNLARIKKRVAGIRHCGRSEAIQGRLRGRQAVLDCFVAGASLNDESAAR